MPAVRRACLVEPRADAILESKEWARTDPWSARWARADRGGLEPAIASLANVNSKPAAPRKAASAIESPPSN